MSIKMKKLVFLFLGIVSLDLLAASRVFYDGFEDGTADLWGVDGSHPKGEVLTTAYDGGAASAGTYFAAINWDASTFSALKLNSWSYTNEMFIRMYWRLDSDMDDEDNAKFMRLGFDGGNTDVTFTRSGTTNVKQEWYVAGGLELNCWASNFSFQDRNWHKVEIYIKHDTDGTDGILSVWKDDILADTGCYPHTGDTFNGSEYWYPWHFPSNWTHAGSHDANNHLYMDEVEIFSDQGTGATGSMADGTIQAAGGGSQTIGAVRNFRIGPLQRIIP